MRLCVFCGSNMGRNPVYRDHAAQLGGLIARRGLGLVYGGAGIGLMRVVADAALAEGGEVIGVIPKDLFDHEVGHEGLTELHRVGSMHERKALMAELSSGFIALPGGIGTLEELFEVWTWGQLGVHAKPCGLLNVAGYFDRLTGFVDHMVEEGFLRDKHRAMLRLSADPSALLEDLLSYQPEPATKWIDAAAT
ncbi:MAG: TIGR00730 family Rossman fold protein [Rhodothalassiaceae bacterium]